jgi:hypothetical protein
MNTICIPTYSETEHYTYVDIEVIGREHEVVNETVAVFGNFPGRV